MGVAPSCFAGFFSFEGAKKDKSKNPPTPSTDEPVVSNDRTTQPALERSAPVDEPVDSEFESENPQTPSQDEPMVSNDKAEEATFDSPTHLDELVDTKIESENPPTPSTDEPVVSNDKAEEAALELPVPLDEPVDPKIKLQQIFAQYRQDGQKDQLAESLKPFFAKYDEDDNKVITRSEFGKLMNDLDVPYQRHLHLFSYWDKDANGSIDCDEFVRLMASLAKELM